MSISKSILLFLLLAGSSLLPSQAQIPATRIPDPEPPQPAARVKDTIPPRVVRPFVRVGFDLSSIGRRYLEPEVIQYEVSLDSEIFPNWLAVIEGGTARVASERSDFQYNSTGYFTRMGFDFNLLGLRYSQQDDMVLIGMRYGYGKLQQEAPEYFLTNPFWGDYSGYVNKSDYHLHWLEFSGGVRTEVFRNFFLGWTLKTRIRLNETKNPELNPYFIGGFGHGKRRAPAMIQFSVYYRIPFY
jgi:hypothetical protein